MNIAQLAFLIFALYLLIVGVLTLIRRKIVGESREYQKYTEASVRRFARIYGWLQILNALILAGAALGGMFLPEEQQLTSLPSIFLFIAFGLTLVLFVLNDIILKRKYCVLRPIDDSDEFDDKEAMDDEEVANDEDADE